MSSAAESKPTKANAKIKDEKKRDIREQNIMAAKCNGWS